MALTNAQHQAAYRKRKAARYTRMEAALKRIEAKLNGTTKPAALAILEIVREGLAP